ncbi:MAG: AzlC family ABC transporter permease [SAR324 cluster bacterium]|nr:AzlC family ABC transporter permease [SAR324 cluster bacterium]MBL7034958.1 AzlC family ABC transporter permease [SAR324 cluster bacterium]
MFSYKSFSEGLKSSLPIVAGYLPVSFAFGVAAEGAELGTLPAVFTSLFIYAGASQFALVGLLKDGVPILSAALITLGLNIRHSLYGPALSRDTENFSLRERLLSAFGLTDEVFAVAFSRIGKRPAATRFWWLMGLEFAAYTSWVGGTLAGSISGVLLLSHYSFLRPALAFALPALFLSLLLSMLKPSNRSAVLISLILAAVFHWSGHTETGIIAAALLGPGLGIIGRRCQ